VAAEAAVAFLSISDTQETINKLLESLGNAVESDRVYICENHVSKKDGLLLMSQKFEWARETVKPQIDNPELQNIPYEGIYKRWFDILSQGKCIKGKVKDFPESERRLLERQDINSILVNPIITKSFFWGFIGFDVCSNSRDTWTDSEIATLKIIGNIIGNAILRRRTEQELEEAKYKAEMAALEAQEATRAKSDFLSNMNHELRTPLNGIIGMIDILKDTDIDEEQKKYIDALYYSGKSLLSLINDTLDLSKIEAGKLELELHPFSMEDLLNKLLDSLTPQAEKKGLYIKLHMEKDTFGSFIGDSSRIRQIFYNLIGNAIKFTKTGGIDIYISHGGEMNGRAIIRFEVKDTGIGIPEDKIDKLFEKFMQADSSTSRRFGGTGLGLAICKKLVEKMGGDISVESVWGEGSAFSFYLPLMSASHTVSNSKNIENEKVNFTWNRQPVILLAEDSIPNQHIAAYFLKDAGCKIDLAANGIEAVEKAGENEYDIIFMDIQMPELDGMQAARIILDKAEEENKPGPVIIALTANAISTERERYLKIGMKDCVFKPFGRVEIEKALQKHLNHLLKSQCLISGGKIESHSDAEKEKTPVWDKKTALERLSGDEALYRKTIEMVLREWPSLFDKIKIAIPIKDFKTIQRCAHTIKGGADFIGGMKLREHAFALEKASTSENLPEELLVLTDRMEKPLFELKDLLEKDYLNHEI